MLGDIHQQAAEDNKETDTQVRIHLDPNEAARRGEEVKRAEPTTMNNKWQPPPPSQHHFMTSFTDNFDKGFERASKYPWCGCCTSPDNKAVNERDVQDPAVLCCQYFLLAPLRFLVFSVPMILLYSALVPIACTVFGLLWIVPTACQTISNRCFGWNIKVCTSICAVPAVLLLAAVIVPFVGLWMGLVVACMVLTDPRHGGLFAALRLLGLAITDVWRNWHDLYAFVRDVEGIMYHRRHAAQNAAVSPSSREEQEEPHYFTDLPIFINILYIALTLLGTLLNGTIGTFWLFVKYWYNLIHQMGDAARQQRCGDGLALLVFHGIGSFVVVPFYAAGLVCHSLCAILVFNRHYEPGLCSSHVSLLKGCNWLWYCTPTYDVYMVDWAFSGRPIPQPDDYWGQRQATYNDGLSRPPHLDRELMSTLETACGSACAA